MRIQGVTSGYRGLPGITTGDRGFQGVTGGDKGLQGVTKDYINFFLTTTLPDTFSWFILHKNTKLKKSEIFSLKRWTNPFRKILIFRFS